MQADLSDSAVRLQEQLFSVHTTSEFIRDLSDSAVRRLRTRPSVENVGFASRRLCRFTRGLELCPRGFDPSAPKPHEKSGFSLHTAGGTFPRPRIPRAQLDYKVPFTHAATWPGGRVRLAGLKPHPSVRLLLPRHHPRPSNLPQPFLTHETEAPALLLEVVDDVLCGHDFLTSACGSSGSGGSSRISAASPSPITSEPAAPRPGQCRTRS